MKKTIPVVLLLFMLACGRPKDLPVLNLSAVIDSQVPDTFSWNSVAEQITYIPVETTDEILLSGSVSVVHISNDSYWVVDYMTATIYRVDKNGKVISSFSRRGRGPGEYINIGYIHVNQENGTIQIFDQSGPTSSKRIVYDLTGRLIKETPGSEWTEKGLGNPLFITNDYLVFSGRTGSAYKLHITDNELNIKESFFPIDPTYSDAEWAIFGQLGKSMNKDIAIIDPMHEETVFAVSNKGIESLFILKAGVHRPDPKDGVRIGTPGENLPYIQGLSIGSIPNYYFISYLGREIGTGIQEVWSKADNRIVSRFKLIFREGGARGFNFHLPSGKMVKALPDYINGDTAAFLIQADATFGEIGIDGIKEDDNPVIVHIKLKN